MIVLNPSFVYFEGQITRITGLNKTVEAVMIHFFVWQYMSYWELFSYLNTQDGVV
jgi:hypothetical protein